MRSLILIIIACLALGISARTKTTRKQLHQKALTSQSAVINRDTSATDTTLIENCYRDGDIEVRGFNKRASDHKESFFLTNRTKNHITHVTLTLYYSDLNGKRLHERTVTVACSIKPGESQMVSVPSFDKSAAFYYYLSYKPRKSATPFQVAAHIISYEIPVNR